ncbi:MAG: serine/threonine-protein kinase [Phycisphaerales bacterium]
MQPDAQSPSPEGESRSLRLDAAAAERLMSRLELEHGINGGNGCPGGFSEGGRSPAGYTIVCRLGSGSSGHVYRAVREGSDRPVSIKVWRDGQRGERAARAWRELDMLGEFNLPVVPRVLDYGSCDGSLYVVTDFIDGVDPVAFAEQHRLDLRDRARLLADIADAVQVLHEHGIIHRDLKPANILIARSASGVPHVFILDLGLAVLAQRSQEGLTLEGQPVGTLGYMAPEQARGERAKVSVRSDVYSLGAIGFQLFCGDTPHEMGESASQTLLRVASTPARNAGELAPHLPQAVIAVLGKAVRSEQSERYASAAELASDVRRWAKGDRVLATPPTAWQRLVMAAARHPVLTTTLVCVGVAGAIVGGASWLTRRALTLPDHLVLMPDRAGVQLMSTGGNVLRTWGPWESRTVGFAAWLPSGCPTPSGKGALMLAPPEDPNFRWPIVMMFDPLRPERPVWDSNEPARAPRHPPGTDVSNQYVAVEGLLVDVFPEVPDGIPELITSHHHTERSATVLRVYDLSGNVRFEVWHDGFIHALHWEPSTREVVIAGVNSERTFAEMGFPQVATSHPVVVFSVRPQDGLHADWVRTPTWPDPPGVHTIAPTWYRYLGPPRCYPFEVSTMSINPSIDEQGHRFRVSLSTPRRPGDSQNQAVFWYFDAHGNASEPRPGSAYIQKFGAGTVSSDWQWRETPTEGR